MRKGLESSHGAVEKIMLRYACLYDSKQLCRSLGIIQIIYRQLADLGGLWQKVNQ